MAVWEMEGTEMGIDKEASHGAVGTVWEDHLRRVNARVGVEKKA